MARVTVEDCLERVPNRFALTVLAAKRARALAEGKARPLVECDNKEAVTALREVAAGKVRFAEDVDTVLGEFIEEQRHQYRVTSSQAGYIEAIDLGGLVDDDEDAELLAGEDDVEELPSDPSLLSKRAKADLEEADDDADGADDIDDDDDATADLDDVEVDVADVGEDDDDAAADDDEE